MKDKIAKKILNMEIDKLMQEPESARDWELITALEIAIEALDTDTHSQGGWISVSEGLPEEDSDYLVTYEAYGGEKIVSKSWFNTRFGFIYENVIAWKELPEPYKKGGAK